MPGVRLRPVLPADLDVHFAQQADPASAAMAVIPVRDRPAFDTHWARILADPEVVVRSVVEDGAVVGSALSFVLEGERVVGYRIGREHWGRGLATAALGALLDELTERPLAAHVAVHNLASLRVLEKHGFVRVGEREDPDTRVVVLRLS